MRHNRPANELSHFQLPCWAREIAKEVQIRRSALLVFAMFLLWWLSHLPPETFAER